MDFNNLVMESLEYIVNTGYLENIIKEQLEKTVKEVVTESLSKKSMFADLVKMSVSEKLNINFNNLNLPDYNTMIIKTIQEYTTELIEVEGMNNVRALMQDMLVPKFDSIKFSDIISLLIEQNEENAVVNEWASISFYHEHSGIGLHFIDFDECEDLENHQCKYHMTINNAGQIVSASKGPDKYRREETWSIGKLRDIRALIFSLYSSKIEVKLDFDDVDTYYNYCNEL